MKQVLQNMRSGKTTVEEIPIPAPQAGMALVRNAASLVSAGTERMLIEFAEKSLIGKARSRPDLLRQTLEKARREGLVPTLRAVSNRLEQSIALGYSSAGIISALGSGMNGFQVGQRVACAGGGYAVHAEYALVPRNLLVLLPDNVDFESAAFGTLGAIALHGFRLTESQIAERVAVIGLGLVGLLTIQMAAASGCHVFGIDINRERVALAKRLGAEAVLRNQAEEAAQSFTNQRGFDSVIICADTSSADPIELAGIISRDRARVVATGAVGLNIPRKMYYEKELCLINSRSYGPGRYDSSYEEKGKDYPMGYVRWTEGRNLEAVVELIANGNLQVTPLITHRFPIEKAVNAYAVITGKRKESFLGVLLTYPQETASVSASRLVFNRQALKREGKVKLGVLGAGLFANATLLPAIKKINGVELIGIASAGGLHAHHAAKKFGFAYATSSESEIMSNQLINTIAILTRHNTHAELTVKALQAGKHVFVEKPLALDNEQLTAVIKQLSNPHNPLFTVGFNRRFAALAQSLHNFLDSRSEPLYMHYRVNAGYIPFNHWVHDTEQGGGRIIGEACHFIDFLVFLVGDLPISVTAHALPDIGKYRQDNASMIFTFPDGSLGTVDYLANGDKSFPKERLEVFCSGRVAVLNDFRLLELVHDGRHKVTKRAQEKGWLGEWKSFSKAICEAGQPPIPYEQLIGVTKATFAAIESIRQSGAQVKII